MPLLAKRQVWHWFAGAGWHEAGGSLAERIILRCDPSIAGRYLQTEQPADKRYGERDVLNQKLSFGMHGDYAPQIKTGGTLIGPWEYSRQCKAHGMRPARGKKKTTRIYQVRLVSLDIGRIAGLTLNRRRRCT